MSLHPVHGLNANREYADTFYEFVTVIKNWLHVLLLIIYQYNTKTQSIKETAFYRHFNDEM